MRREPYLGIFALVQKTGTKHGQDGAIQLGPRLQLGKRASKWPLTYRTTSGSHVCSAGAEHWMPSYSSRLMVQEWFRFNLCSVLSTVNTLTQDRHTQWDSGAVPAFRLRETLFFFASTFWPPTAASAASLQYLTRFRLRVLYHARSLSHNVSVLVM